MPLVRLETVHPILVHFTLGALPFLLLAYAVAARRRSAAWTFAGDTLLFFTAAITLATVAFGLVSNAVVDWPGGLSTWRWLHLGLGAFTALSLLVLAVARALRRRKHPVGRAFAGMLIASLGGLVTGWIGGELLVFRSGMAVEAAAGGALAPPLTSRSPRPGDVTGAMHDLRASWAAATAELASMVVHDPDAREYAAVERHARDIGDVARWIAEEHGPDGKHAHAHGDDDSGGEGARALVAGAHTLAHQADELAQAAHARCARPRQPRARRARRHVRELPPAAPMGRGPAGARRRSMRGVSPARRRSARSPRPR